MGDEEELSEILEPAPDMLSCPEGQAYFQGGLEWFCEEHGAAMVMMTAGQIYLSSGPGHKFTNVEEWGKKSAAKLRTVQ